MEMKILVAVDKSEESQMALRYTCHLLEHFRAEVDALYVKPDVAEMAADGAYAPFVTRGDLDKAVESETQVVEEQILDACEICIEGRVVCRPHIVTGDPAEEILHMSNRGGYDLIVMGSPGRSSLEGLLLGAVHAKILHHAQRPVLLVRQFRPVQRILVAYRGSRCDQGALGFVAGLFEAKGPKITVMHVRETGEGESEQSAESCLLRGEETLKARGHEPLKKMAKGGFVEEILKDVAIRRYDLLVLGAYGHRQPRYLKLISDEALDLVRLTTRPVLVYRDKAEA
jgi:nucleotide-binding universal stress UspA family protein